MKIDSFKKLRKGSALVIVYFAMVMLLITGAAFFTQVYSISKLTIRHKDSIKAFNIAEAGLERAIYELRSDFINDTTPSWSDGDINGISCGPNTNDFYVFLNEIEFQDGAYTVTLKNIDASSSSIIVQSTGTINNISRTLQIYLRMDYVNIWDNVIFAGTGASGKMINGNVDIRGSVHILGTNLNIDDVAVDMAMELGGSAHIGNNYLGLESSLLSKVPELEYVTYNGEYIQSLNAILRVKQGIVSLSGSATAGDPNVADNSYKETLDGTYVTDGFGGNQGVANVFSDNGYGQAYDLGDSVSFPSLSSPYGGYSSYMNYLKSNALVISNQDDINMLSNLTPTSSFSFSSGENSISMDGNGNLNITGIVYIENGGGFNISSQGNVDTVNYTGKGSVLATGDININANFITAGADSFPANVIGFMTPNNIIFNESQINVMGLFYAENKITCGKQTDVMGVFVSNFFDMGNQVPSIYQVPEVINNLPPGLIGTQSSYLLKIVAWQEK